MKELELRFNQLRQKMSAIDNLLNSKTAGVIPGFFDPMSLSVSFNTSEATFLRLISFFYCLSHEGFAKLNFDFLIDKFKARGLDSQFPETYRKTCHHLRTASQHNMNLLNIREQGIIYACEDWFENECGSKRPSTEEEWKKCASALINDSRVLFDKFEDVISNILDPNDEFSETVIDDWNTKLTNFHSHHEYVEIAQKVAVYMGIGWIDLTRFCLNYHKAWLAELAEYPSHDFSGLAQRQIERDLLEDIKKKRLPLPFTGEVLMQRLNLKPGPSVKVAREKAQELYLQKLYTIDEMIIELKQFFQTE